MAGFQFFLDEFQLFGIGNAIRDCDAGFGRQAENALLGEIH